MTDASIHRLAELRVACPHRVARPLVLAERDPDVLALTRCHEHARDRWLTRHFGHRLQVTADTARLLRGTWVPHRRPLMTAGSASRPLTQREYTLLALALAAVAAGPNVTELISQLHRSGASLRHHGNFDAPGIAICARMHAAGVRPWRMTAADYAAALARAEAADLALDVDLAPKDCCLVAQDQDLDRKAASSASATFVPVG